MTSGDASFADLCRKFNWNPDTYTVLGGRGRHLYFGTPVWDLRDSAGLLGAGLDIRAQGGYIVAEGSRHLSGVTYSRDMSRPLTLQQLPEFLRTELETRHLKSVSVEADYALSEDQVVPEGQRNEFLFRRGCALRGTGSSYETICAELLMVNEAQCVPPLPLAEIQRIARSASQYLPNRSAAKTGFGWYKLPIGEWLCNTERIRLQDAQRSWYDTLEKRSIMHWGLLPADPSELYALAGATSKQAVFCEQIRDVLREYDDVIVDGRHMLRSKRLEAVRVESERLIDQRRAAGQASADRRKAVKSAQRAA